MALRTIAATTSKCATCERWSGARKRLERQINQQPDAVAQVEFNDAEANGACVGGPWDGNLRDPLTRCGRWAMWSGN